MSIPINEQETTINYSRVDQSFNVWTSDQTLITKLDKKYPRFKEHTDKTGFVWAVEYVGDKDLLSFRTTRKKGMPLSDKQKAALLEGRKKATA